MRYEKGLQECGDGIRCSAVFHELDEEYVRKRPPETITGLRKFNCVIVFGLVGESLNGFDEFLQLCHAFILASGKV